MYAAEFVDLFDQFLSKSENFVASVTFAAAVLSAAEFDAAAQQWRPAASNVQAASDIWPKQRHKAL